MITDFDNEERRCPMLGHQIRFEYCRKVNQGSPCRKTFDCWFERFPIVDFMNEHFSEEEIKRIKEPAKDKVLSLLELIQQAQERTKSQE
ncbi:MAG: hypothetical protein GXO75_11570 [Calditrichaeota bacterium]|nr:hypothetical protein [Calditrichota bacterium]